MARDFKNIKAWQYADDLAVLVYSKTKSFPKEELYGITSQLRRAVVSVPTNIAEGASREHKKEYLHFLYVARGSMLKDDEYIQVEDPRKEAAKTLQGLINSVRKEANKTKDLS